MERSSRELAGAASEFRSVRDEAAAAPESRRDAPAPRRRVVWAVALVAAAAAIVIALRNTLDGGASPAAPNVTLGDGVRCEAPLGETREYAAFRWAAALPPGGSFELDVRDAAAGADSAPVLSRKVSTSSWVPSPEERGALPRRIHWTVTMRDAGGAAVGRGSASASLSQH